MKMLIHIIFLAMMSCCTEPDIKPNPCQLPDCSDTLKYPLELSWQKPLRVDTQYTLASNLPIILKDEVAFFYDVTETENILFVNKENQSVNRYTGKNSGSYRGGFYDEEVGLITSDHETVYAGTSYATMKKIASAPSGLQFGSNNALIGKYLYLSDVYDYVNFQVYVIRVNIHTGEVGIDKTLIDPQHKGANYSNISAPVFFVLGNNDTLFSYVKYINVDDKPIVTIETYNHSNNQLLWIDSSFKMPGAQHDMVQFNDKMIGVPGSNIYCVNPLNGDVYWKTPYIGGRDWKGWETKNLILINDKIYCLDQGHFVELDANTGKVLYDSPEIFSAQTNSRMSYFDGVFYWTAIEGGGSSWIFGLRQSDRKIVLKTKSPNAKKFEDTNFDISGLVIDPTKRLAYTQDGFMAYCFNIPTSYK